MGIQTNRTAFSLGFLSGHHNTELKTIFSYPALIFIFEIKIAKIS